MPKRILAAADAAAATAAAVCVSASWEAASASSRRDFRGAASSPTVSKAAIEAAAFISLLASSLLARGHELSLNREVSSTNRKKKSSVKIRPRTTKALDGIGTHVSFLCFLVLYQTALKLIGLALRLGSVMSRFHGALGAFRAQKAGSSKGIVEMPILPHSMLNPSQNALKL